MPGNPVERRYPRVKIPTKLVVAWQTASQRHVSRVEIVGLGGLFIVTSEAPPVGTNIQLLFDISGGEVRARAVVRDVRAKVGMGIEILAMQPEHRARLTQWLKQFPSKTEQQQ